MTNWVATILIYSQTKVEKGLGITELAPIDSKGRPNKKAPPKSIDSAFFVLAVREGLEPSQGG
jgi:hypothetical protein